LFAQGAPTYWLISELTSNCGTGYIGLDNWRVGGTAAYISGGGIIGVLAALQAAGRGPSLITIGHEITENTRNGLMDEHLAMVLAHPIGRLAVESVGQMRRDVSTGTGMTKRMIGFDIYTPENI